MPRCQEQKPQPELRGQADQLDDYEYNCKKTDHKMEIMLHNQALAMNAFQYKWQMTGNEAQTFVLRRGSQFEYFVRCEMSVVERF